MAVATISSKNQITIPKEILEKLSLKTGRRVVIEVQDRKEAVLKPISKSLTDYYQGLGKGSWKKLGGGEAFIEKERKSWT